MVIIDYTFDNGWSHSYSIKIYNDGKAYLKKSTLKTDRIYVNNHLNIAGLKGLVDSLIVAKINAKYEDAHLQDGSSFNALVYDNKGGVSNYYVYGDKPPELLNKLKHYAFISLKQKGWYELKDTIITFTSVTNFKTPPKIDTNVRFLPPKPDIE